MIKVLAGIPTRKRNTSGKIADVLAEVADEVIVVSQGAVCNSTKSNVVIVERPVDFGLIPARNLIIDYALKNEYDVVIESDDDLAFSSDVPAQLIEEVVNHPTLGSIGSQSRAYFNWSKEVKSTKNFLLAPCSPQLWACRTEILREIGPWNLAYLDDREYGARLWKAGYAVGQLHMSMNLTHNPFIPRSSDKTKTGGLVDDENNSKLLAAIDYMNAVHGDILRISVVNAQHRKFMTRYNWDYMIKLAHQRFGYALNYEDTKGRQL